MGGHTVYPLLHFVCVGGVRTSLLWMAKAGGWRWDQVPSLAMFLRVLTLGTGTIPVSDRAGSFSSLELLAFCLLLETELECSMHLSNLSPLPTVNSGRGAFMGSPLRVYSCKYCVLTDCSSRAPFLKDKQHTEVTKHLVMVSLSA